MSVERPPKSIVWKGNAERSSGRKVSNLRSVSLVKLMDQEAEEDTTDATPAQPTRARLNSDDPPPLISASEDSSSEVEATTAQAVAQPKQTALMPWEHDGRPRFPNEGKSHPGISLRERQRMERDLRHNINSWKREQGTTTTNTRRSSAPRPQAAPTTTSDNAAETSSAQPQAHPTREATATTQEGNIRINEPERSQTSNYLEHQQETEFYEAQYTNMRKSRIETISDLTYDLDDISSANDRNYAREAQDHYARHELTPFDRYIWYREEGGRRKFFPGDKGDEDYYARWEPTETEEGIWMEDYNYIRPSAYAFRDAGYREWYQSTHPLPHDMKHAVEQWVHRRRQLERCQTAHSRSYESYLRAEQQDSSKAQTSQTWDNRRLYNLHMERTQTALDLVGTVMDTPTVITEQDVDDELIRLATIERNKRTAQATSSSIPMPSDNRRIQSPDIRPDTHPESIGQPIRMGLIATSREFPGPYKGCEYADVHIPGPFSVENHPFKGPNDMPPADDYTQQSRTTQLAVEKAVEALQKTDTRLPPTTKKVRKTISNKSDIRTQTATTLYGRMRQTKHNLQANKQRNVNAIVDTGAQVTTMPESAVNLMPHARNHRDAPPGTAVRYGNGEMEIIERLVDIGHFEVQVTPDNCTSTLISVDQIVKDGHTVTFSETHTVIEDNKQRYSLSYPREPDSREWMIPLTAMEDITQLRRKHPLIPRSI